MGIFKDGAYYPLGTGEEVSQGEYEYQYALCNEPPDDLPQRKVYVADAPEGRWTVRGGAQLEIAKMSDAHLRNAIAFFERHGEGQNKKIEELRQELARRGGETT